LDLDGKRHGEPSRAEQSKVPVAEGRPALRPHLFCPDRCLDMARASLAHRAEKGTRFFAPSDAPVGKDRFEARRIRLAVKNAANPEQR
jgi:hypothetical protein